jgi:hypothetical protein
MPQTFEEIFDQESAAAISFQNGPWNTACQGHKEARRVLDAYCSWFARAGTLDDAFRIWPAHTAAPAWIRWPDWMAYIATMNRGDRVIGTGICGLCACRFPEELDPDRQFLPRVDFVVYRTDFTFVRLHPGSRRGLSAKFKFGGWVR